MKKYTMLAFAFAVFMVSCKKEQVNSDISELSLQSGDKSHMSFENEQEYEQLITELDEIFYPENGITASEDVQIEPTNKEMDLATYISTVEVISPSDVIKKELDLIKKYSQLNNHISMLDLYYEGALLESKEAKMAFVAKHSDNFYMISDIDQIGMKISKSFAAILNTDGKVQIADFVYEHTPAGYIKYNLEGRIVETNEVLKEQNNARSWGVATDHYTRTWQPLPAYHFGAVVERFFEQRLVAVWEKIEVTHWRLVGGTWGLFTAGSVTVTQNFNNSYIDGAWLSEPPCSFNRDNNIYKKEYGSFIVSKVQRMCGIGSVGYYENWPSTVCFVVDIFPGYPQFADCSDGPSF